MAEALEIGVGDLLAELAAHTDCVLGHFAAAGAVAVLLFKAVADHFDVFFVGIKYYLHDITSPFQFKYKAFRRVCQGK